MSRVRSPPTWPQLFARAARRNLTFSIERDPGSVQLGGGQYARIPPWWPSDDADAALRRIADAMLRNVLYQNPASTRSRSRRRTR